MIFIYIFIIGIPAVVIFFIIKKILKAKKIKQLGVKTEAIITNVHITRFGKGSMDILTLEYKDAAGRYYPAKATVAVGKYKTGDHMEISYIPQNPTQYAFDDVKGYWGILIFCILLLLFAIFASYKISELVQAGNYHFTG